MLLPSNYGGGYVGIVIVCYYHKVKPSLNYLIDLTEQRHEALKTNDRVGVLLPTHTGWVVV